MANNKNGTKDQIMQKEAAAFRLRQHGWSQLRIAKHLGMTQLGVSKALKRITTRFSKYFFDDVRHTKYEHIAQLEHLAEEAIFAWYKSKKKDPDPRFLSEFRKAKTDIRKIIGADLPIEPENESDEITEIKITVMKPDGEVINREASKTIE